MYGIMKEKDRTGKDSVLTAVMTAPVSIDSEKRTTRSKTLNLKRKSSSTDAQCWAFSSGLYFPTNPVKFYADLLENGHSGHLWIRPPALVQTDNYAVGVYEGKDLSVTYKLSPFYRRKTGKVITGFGVVKLTSGVSAKNNVIPCSLKEPASISQARCIEGTYVQFDGHDKLYFVKEFLPSVVSENNYDFNLVITPPLVRPVVLAEDCYLGDSVAMPVIIDNDGMMSLTYEDGLLARIKKISFVEAL